MSYKSMGEIYQEVIESQPQDGAIWEYQGDILEAMRQFGISVFNQTIDSTREVQESNVTNSLHVNHDMKSAVRIKVFGKMGLNKKEVP